MNFNTDLRPRDAAIKYSVGLCPSAFTDDIQGHRDRSNADDTFQVIILSSFDLLCKSSTSDGSLTVQWNEKLWDEAVPRERITSYKNPLIEKINDLRHYWNEYYIIRDGRTFGEGTRRTWIRLRSVITVRSL